uniref:RRM domain-containing protein n=4 Tax=Meloidogyne TaxID=189290 RepID=A0A6V7X116_MELEN|nr:unnamed protein product [Meloidogyne enterolobii]CAD2193016.1 unnamed protein product [Meloidogyne enterolobii]
MKMVNNTASSYSSNENAILSANKRNNNNQHLVNAISMESLDSVISTNNGAMYGNGSSEAQSQVRTLFVSGLPADVKSRELYLLFRAYPGYESSQLKMTLSNRNGISKSSTPVGFVTFASRQDADDVRQKLQGVKFDPELSQTLRLELARSNTKVTKPVKQSPQANHISPVTSGLTAAILPPPSSVLAHNITVAQLAAIQQQQLTAVLLNQHHDNSVVNTGGTNGTVLAAAAQHQQQLLAAAASALDHQRHLAFTASGSDIQQQLAALAAGGSTLLGNTTNAASLAATNPQLAAVAALAAQQQHQHRSLATHWPSNGQQQILMAGQQNSPCSTLFVGNLGPAATTSPSIVEEELKSVFGVFPGFSRIRMHTKRGSPVAFVEFFEVGQAVHVMHALQGFGLSANNGVGTGIRIEFAKTRMGDTFLSKHDGMGGRGDR